MTLKDLGKMIELERFLMGMGKYEFVKMIGIHYHTYQSFLNQDKVTRPSTGSIIVNFLISRGKQVSDLEL